MNRLGVIQRLVKWGYTGLYLPALPLVLGYWISRPDSRRRLGEYLGRGADRVPRGGDPPFPIWVHAVSAGETGAVMPVLRGLRQAGHSFFLTTTISDAVESAARHDVSFQGVSFMPLDIPWLLGRMLDRLQPAAVLISETDLWPNFLLELAERRIPAYLVNGRISARLARGWRLARPLLGGPAVRALRRAFVQSEVDMARLVEMGLPADRVTVAGNTKYEQGEPPPLPAEAEALVVALGRQARAVVVAGSTHDPEERYLLDVMGAAAGEVPLLVVAPRNPRRAEEVHELARSRGRRVGYWSQLAKMRGDPSHYDVVVVDVMGQLASIYRAARVAYVGGGFGSTGGHNLLEAAFHGKPVLGGPDFRNFAADVVAFSREGAFRSCESEAALADELWRLIEHPEEAVTRGRRARELLERGQRAGALTVAGILEDLRAHPPPHLLQATVT